MNCIAFSSRFPSYITHYPIPTYILLRLALLLQKVPDEQLVRRFHETLIVLQELPLMLTLLAMVVKCPNSLLQLLLVQLQR